jgi:hypothetical protein
MLRDDGRRYMTRDAGRWINWLEGWKGGSRAIVKERAGRRGVLTQRR